MKRGSAAFLAAFVMVGALLPASAGAAAGRPRIVKAAVIDANGDQSADKVVLTYSEKIRHRRDDDGRYPFRIEGFTIRAIKAAKGTKLLTILLKPHKASDVGRRAVVTYRHTQKGAVTDRAKNQAVEQTFKKVLALAAPVPTATERLLTAEVQGPGSVVSSPEGIACPPTCSAVFPTSTSVTLEAVVGPQEGAAFVGWEGSCTGTQPSCSLTLLEDAGVSATFELQEEDPPSDGGVITLPPLPSDPLPIPPLP